MNIVQIIPGSGGSFYCGNCLRDSKFVEALRKEGHQVIKVPMYLPLFANEHEPGDVPVFYGAVSLYLKQMYPIFRKAPVWLDKLLNSGPMLKLAASMAGSTDAVGLEDMTVSMLLGEEGSQKEELEKMVDWIAEHLHPDIIHISNALLLGLARRLREKTGVPVVCSLQDEDVWVDVMEPAFRDKVWKLMQQKSADVDAFIAVSQYFGDLMKERLHLPEDMLYSVYLGVDPSEYDFIPSTQKPRTIGYISRMCQANGFDIVIDAFILLKKLPEFNDVKLIVTGGSTSADTKYIKMLKRRIDRAGLHDQVDFHLEFDGQPRKEFFAKVAVGTVPVRNGEAFGIYLPELMASGIPIVQPALGAFPEIVEISGGGVVYQPNTPQTLMEAWSQVLSDSGRLESLSHQARKGVEQFFNIHDHAREMVGVYQELINKKGKDVVTVN
jgi:glycosyltransferase involved in cell wall biosynthesis